MTEGLPRKLKYVFLLQAAMAVLVIVLGSAAGMMVMRQHVAQEAVQDEATLFWKRYAADPAARPPFGSTLKGWFVPRGMPDDAVPARYRALSPGMHHVGDGEDVVYVQEHAGARLWLQVNERRALQWSAWLVATPVLLALLALVASAYYSYRLAKRLVQPLGWLAEQVRDWNPRDPEPAFLALDRLPPDSTAETHQLAQALQRMSERTRAFIRREREFTRDASHELRTPLTVIRMASDLALADDSLPTVAQRSLQRIQRAGRDMEAVIDAFLILARESEVTPQVEEFPVRDVVYEEVANAQALLAGKPVTLRVEELAAPRLVAAPAVLAVMVGNLLRNACTFTESGDIRVRIEPGRLQIIDTGIGMDPATLLRAHDPFYRADPMGNPQGKGMGLSIVQRLGDRFGWPVSFESSPGVGTTATLEFASSVRAASTADAAMR